MNNSEKKLEIELKNEVSELDKLNNKLAQFWNEHNLDSEELGHINLSLEEIITNIIKYGYNDDLEHTIKVVIKLNGTQKLQLEIIDDGIEFNPFEHPAPDTSKSL